MNQTLPLGGGPNCSSALRTVIDSSSPLRSRFRGHRTSAIAFVSQAIADQRTESHLPPGSRVTGA